MEPPSYLFLILLGLFLVNAVFVAIESAIVRAHAALIRDQKNLWGSKAALYLLKKGGLSLSSTQLGITTTTVFVGWIGLRFTESVIEIFSLTSLFERGAMIFLAAGILIGAHVVIGELLGKAIAVRHPEATLRILAPFMIGFMRLAQPLIFLIHVSGNALTRILGMKHPSPFGRIGSSGELAALISQSSEEGVLDEEEKEMLHGIIGFSETVAREVMTPRTDLVTVPITASKEEVLAIVTKAGLSRFPVTGENVDQIEGILLARDLLAAIASSKPFSIKELIRDPYFIPGTKPIDDLLNEFKNRKIHMAIVLDEHGGVDGVVTLEDLIEEIVGEIYDESDIPEEEVVLTAEGDVLVDAGVHISDINNDFSLNIPEGDYDTLGGFIFSTLGRIPSEGDSLLLTNQGLPIVKNGAYKELNTEEDDIHHFDTPVVELKVEEVEGNRIERIRIIRKSPQEDTPDELAA